MNVSQIQLLFLYNQWANTRLLDAADSVSSEDFLREGTGSHSSLCDRLMHVLIFESMWLARWKGIPHMTEFDPVEIKSQDLLREKWRELGNDQINFISKISEESLEELVEYDTDEGESLECPLWKMIDDMVKHSMHHRGQMTEILRQMGTDPPELHLIAFIEERSS